MKSWYIFFGILALTGLPAHGSSCPKGASPPSNPALANSTSNMAAIFALGGSNNLSTATKSSPHFSGKVTTTWDDDGRCMTLLENYSYVDENGLEWAAWKGMVTDGATIPPAVWSLIGGPYEGLYRNAAVVHDAACIRRDRSWQASARMFHEAMLTNGVDRVKALLMFEAVFMFGPKWTIKTSAGHVALDKKEALLADLRNFERVPENQTIKVHSRQTTSLASGAVNLSIEIPPPVDEKFTFEDFAKYKDLIEEKERAQPGSVTLAQIETFTPQK